MYTYTYIFSAFYTVMFCDHYYIVCLITYDWIIQGKCILIVRALILSNASDAEVSFNDRMDK